MGFNSTHEVKMSGESYVYYNRLATDAEGNLKLYNKAKSVLDFRLEESSSSQKIANYFAELRNNEFKKEVALLNQKFGLSIGDGYDVGNESVGEELIKAFNKLLNLKEVFNRNLSLIQDTQGDKQIITYFDFYFDKEWSKNEEKIYEDIMLMVQKGFSMQQSISQIIEQWTPKLTRSALIFMFEEADTEAGIKTRREELQQAYKELIPILQDVNNNVGNDFINSFVTNYGLNNITDRLVKEQKISPSLKDLLKKFKYTKSEHEVHIRGGAAAENLGSFIATHALEKFNKQMEKTLGNKNIKYEVLLSGKTKGTPKADFSIGIDLPTDTVQQWFDDSFFGSRSQNVGALQNLQKQLNSVNDGFIIFVNAKNNTIRDDFRGFKAGDPVSLKSWKSMMELTPLKAKDLVFSVMQLIPGAIGGDSRVDITKIFARTIASSLFDDFETTELEQKTGSKNIHLLYLNGIYFPMSFYYHLLSETFLEYSRESARALVKVNIKLPEQIKYPEQADQEGVVNPWGQQRQEALEKIKLSFHFLANYKKLMKKIGFVET